MTDICKEHLESETRSRANNKQEQVCRCVRKNVYINTHIYIPLYLSIYLHTHKYIYIDLDLVVSFNDFLKYGEFFSTNIYSELVIVQLLPTTTTIKEEGGDEEKEEEKYHRIRGIESGGVQYHRAQGSLSPQQPSFRLLCSILRSTPLPV